MLIYLFRSDDVLMLVVTYVFFVVGELLALFAFMLLFLVWLLRLVEFLDSVSC